MPNREITYDRLKKHPVGNYNRVTLFSSPLSTLKITSSEFIYIAINETSNVGRAAHAPLEKVAASCWHSAPSGRRLLTDSHPK